MLAIFMLGEIGCLCTSRLQDPEDRVTIDIKTQRLFNLKNSLLTTAMDFREKKENAHVRNIT